MDLEFKCKVCDKSFDKLEGLKIHASKIHKKSVDLIMEHPAKKQRVIPSVPAPDAEIIEEEVPKLYKCPECNVEFKSNEVLKLHVHLHARLLI